MNMKYEYLLVGFYTNPETSCHVTNVGGVGKGSGTTIRDSTEHILTFLSHTGTRGHLAGKSMIKNYFHNDSSHNGRGDSTKWVNLS